MTSTERPCKYIKCPHGKNGKPNVFPGGKRAKYCTPKCGTYQRRLDNKLTNKAKDNE